MSPEKKSRLKKTLTTTAPLVLAAVAGALAASIATELTKKESTPIPENLWKLNEHQVDLLAVEDMIRTNGDQYVVSDGDKIWYADSLAWLIEHNPGMK
jgi:hypothetical protein